MLQISHHLHFTTVAVKAQAEALLAYLEFQGLGLEAGHLLRTEVLAVAYTVFGDHQHHLPLLLVRLKGGGDALYPVVAEEPLGRAVQHVAEVG